MSVMTSDLDIDRSPLLLIRQYGGIRDAPRRHPRRRSAGAGRYGCMLLVMAAYLLTLRRPMRRLADNAAQLAAFAD